MKRIMKILSAATLVLSIFLILGLSIVQFVWETSTRVNAILAQKFVEFIMQR